MPEIVNLSKVNPCSPIFYLKIGDTEVTQSNSVNSVENFISFSMKLTAIDVASDIEIIVYDDSALALEYEILRGYQSVQFKFGQDLENMSKLYDAQITDYDLEFVNLGVQLTLKLILGAAGATSEESKSYTGTPSDIVKKLAKEEGWEIGKITSCRKNTKDTYTRSGKTVSDFITQDLIPKAVSTKGETNYTFYTSSKDGKTLVYFTPHRNSQSGGSKDNPTDTETSTINPDAGIPGGGGTVVDPGVDEPEEGPDNTQDEDSQNSSKKTTKEKANSGEDSTKEGEELEYNLYEIVIGRDHEAVISFKPSFSGLMYNLLGGIAPNGGTTPGTTTPVTNNPSTGDGTDPGNTGSGGTGTFNWPVSGAPRISSPFGPRKAPTKGASTFHRGIDIPGAVGTPISAADAGKVVVAKTGYNGGRGNYVVIDHGNGYGTLYQHLSSIDVQVGQSVSKGSTIAKMGNTGVGTGPHLHFEVHENFSGTKGTPVDPQKYVSAGGGGGSSVSTSRTRAIPGGSSTSRELQYTPSGEPINPTDGNETIETTTPSNTNTDQVTNNSNVQVVVPTIDKLTNNLITASTDTKLIKRRVGTSSYNSQDLGKLAEYLFTRSVTLSNSAELVLRGDASLQPQSFVAIMILTKDGFFHHSSGLYQILEVSHDLDMGNYTTTLNMFRRGMEVGEDGSIRLLDAGDSTFSSNLAGNNGGTSPTGPTSGGNTPAAGGITGDFVTSDEIMQQFDSKFKGLPYRLGAKGAYPQSSYDCSGFVCAMVKELAKAHGGDTRIDIGGTQSMIVDYANYSVGWNQSNLQPGDILIGVNDDQSHGVDRHVVMYVGNGTICHAGSPLKYGPIEDQWKRFSKMDHHDAIRILAAKNIYTKVPADWQNKVH